MNTFELDARLARDSEPVIQIGLCELRLIGDQRWPWFILVPQRPKASELFDLTPLDQTMLTFEVNIVAAALKKATGAVKINVATLGNIVRQLHIHVIARFEGDANWPGPVWGFGQPEPYEEHRKTVLVRKILEALSS